MVEACVSPSEPLSTWRELLAAAADVYDAPASPLSHSGQQAWKGGFQSGAEWMAQALCVLRGSAPSPVRGSFQWLGSLKYALCIAAAVGVLMLLTLLHHPLWSPLALPAFYAVEVQFLFLFPLALDGNPQPMRDSIRWTRRAGGTVRAMGVVMPVAAVMMFGGLAGRGFVRSWCLGCLAICIWYERVRLLPIEPASLHIRHERVEIGLATPVRLLYASDLHLGWPWTNSSAGVLLAAASSSRPDIIVLGGDLADRTAGVGRLKELVSQLAAIAPVVAVKGNHDRCAGWRAVRRAVREGGGEWLGRPFVFMGITLCRRPPADANRVVLCLHDPAGFTKAAGCRLVLAGHLHGGQCVLMNRNGRLYPGAWFSRWTGLRFRIRDKGGDREMLVSRGVADTVPLRWNCPREVLLCELT